MLLLSYHLLNFYYTPDALLSALDTLSHSQQPCEVGTTFIPVLQMRKLSHRAVKLAKVK